MAYLCCLLLLELLSNTLSIVSFDIFEVYWWFPMVHLPPFSCKSCPLWRDLMQSIKCLSWQNCHISCGLDPGARPPMLRRSLGSLLSFLQAIMTRAAIPRTKTWHVLKKNKQTKKNIQWHLLKTWWGKFDSGPLWEVKGTTALRFCSGGDTLGSTTNTVRVSGNS